MAQKTEQNVVQPAQSDLETVVAQALAQVKTIRQALAQFDLAQMTVDQREHSTGKFRNGESVAVSAVLKTVDAMPGLFASLAAQDRGVDDNVVETGPTREALQRRDTLAPLLAELQGLTQNISDDVLSSGELIKEVSGPAYAIIKVNAAVNPKVSTLAAPAIDFYSAPARTRAANKRKAEKQNRVK